MSKTLNANIDPVQLIKDIFGSDKNRNDLAVGIQNNTNSELIIEYYVHHGSSTKVSANNRIKLNQQWECGIHAKGAGSNIGVSITMPNGAAFAFMAATPVNGENYFKISHNSKGYKSAKVAWNGADKHNKHYSDSGYYNDEYNNYQLLANISGASPAACTIEINHPDQL